MQTALEILELNQNAEDQMAVIFMNSTSTGYIVSTSNNTHVMREFEFVSNDSDAFTFGVTSDRVYLFL